MKWTALLSVLLVILAAGVAAADRIDSDGDGLEDDIEIILGTDPFDDDTDDDGLMDGTEELVLGTSPLDTDTDDDLLFDGMEVGLSEPEGEDTDMGVFMPDYDMGTTTDPLDDDTDDDDILDGEEDQNQNGAVEWFEIDPNDPDTDGDGLSDGEEILLHGSDPVDQDTDDDGGSDGLEIGDWLSDPVDADTDDDGLSDGEEGFGPHWAYPHLADSDSDGLNDGLEAGRDYPVLGGQSDAWFIPYGGTESGWQPDTDPLTTTEPLNADTDADGLIDGAEDADGDGAVDVGETDPNDPDSDDDLLSDGDEVNVYGTDPLSPDTDEDGLSDYDEIFVHMTDPLDPDTDDDGLSDGDEVNIYMTDPLSADTDGDGLSDYDEIFVYGTYPTGADTDDDGLSDGDEVLIYGTDPLNHDTDGDGLTDGDEVNIYGTDPLNPDTDEDGLSDYDEIFAYFTDPLDPDTDGDGLSDYDEIFVYGTYPTGADTDDDGLSDGDEVLIYGTDPLNHDTDGDGLTDGDEVNVYGTDPLNPDTDGDTFSDGAEITAGSDPLDPDSTPLTIHDPTILAVTDVGNDQGRNVRVRWESSDLDVPGSPSPITSYTIYRRIDEARRHIETAGAEAVPPTMLVGDWDFVVNVPAATQEIYNAIASTLCDSTDAGICWSVFLVRGHTDDPALFYDSPPDSGYSVDNLAPAPPRNLEADGGAEQVMLTWEPNEEEDLNYYAVYRGLTEIFELGDPIGFAIEGAFEDLDPPVAEEWWYRVTAYDFNGNESEPSDAAGVTATGVGDELPTAYFLSPAMPNPFVETTSISFAIPLGANASGLELRVYDARGRLVRVLAEGTRAPGVYHVTWDGTDRTGLRAASGVYFFRLTTSDFETRQKAVLLR